MKVNSLKHIITSEVLIVGIVNDGKLKKLYDGVLHGLHRYSSLSEKYVNYIYYSKEYEKICIVVLGDEDD